MTDASIAGLRLGAELLAPTALGSFGAFVTANPGLQAWLAGRHAVLDRELGFLRLRTSARTWLLVQLVACASLLFLAAARAALWPLGVLAAVLWAPGQWLASARRARTQAIERQLDRWLLALAKQLKATPALGDALVASARLCAPPLADELWLAHKQTRLGLPLDRALTELGERMKSPLLGAAIASLRVARATGGDLSTTLEASAASLRELARLESVMRTKTAEGKAQAFLIGALPVPLVLGLQRLNPGLLAPLLEPGRGHAVLLAAGALWLAALVSARRILAVEF